MRHHPHSETRAGALLVLTCILALAASLLTFLPSASAQGGPLPRGLTLSVGPRDGAWKRVFNPLRPDSEVLYPAAAGI